MIAPIPYSARLDTDAVERLFAVADRQCFAFASALLALAIAAALV